MKHDSRRCPDFPKKNSDIHLLFVKNTGTYTSEMNSTHNTNFYGLQDLT